MKRFNVCFIAVRTLKLNVPSRPDFASHELPRAGRESFMNPAEWLCKQFKCKGSRGRYIKHRLKLIPRKLARANTVKSDDNPQYVLFAVGEY